MPESPWEWSTTASSNANADSQINWAEGMLPGGVNNSARSMMAALKKLIEDQGGKASTTGSSNAYVLATQADVNALADGVSVAFVANHTNTGAATLAVDGLGAKAIRKGADVALVAGDIVANGHYIAQYDASANAAAGAWLLLNPALPTPGTSTETFVLSGDITPTQITADQNNYAPTGFSTATVLRLSTDATRTITGLAGGADGRVVEIHNIGSQAIILSKENAGSLAANRFFINQDIYLFPHHVAVLWYDATTAGWRCPGVTSIAGVETVFFDAGGMIPRTTNGPVVQLGETTTNKVMRVSLLFDATTNEFAQFKAMAPKNWDGGTITYMVLWSHASTVTNFNVKWGLQGFLIVNAGSLETAWGTEIETIDTGAAVDGTYISAESDPMTFAGTPAHPCFWNFQVYRDAASVDDTMIVDAWLLGVVVFYKTKANSDL